MTDTYLKEGKSQLSEIKTSATEVLKLDAKGHSLEKNICLRKNSMRILEVKRAVITSLSDQSYKENCIS